MRAYIRIIEDAESESHEQMGEQRLHACLLAAPGVEQIKNIDRHVKGGYRIVLEVSSDSNDEFVEFISTRGSQLVL